MKTRVVTGALALLMAFGSQGSWAGTGGFAPPAGHVLAAGVELAVEAGGDRLEPIPVADMMFLGEQCTGAINWAMVGDFGLYLIEFCWMTPGVKGVAYGDFHRRAGGSGSLGGYMQTKEFYCTVPADYAAMTPKARSTFC